MTPEERNEYMRKWYAARPGYNAAKYGSKHQKTLLEKNPGYNEKYTKKFIEKHPGYGAAYMKKRRAGVAAKEEFAAFLAILLDD